MPSKNQVSNGLTYVPQKPAFLANFGQPSRTSPPPGGRVRGSASGSRGGGADGREALPERPREGRWAQGSGDEREEDEGSDDEWGERFGGGGDDGPQVVVLKEGRHLSGEEVKRERRRAKGLPSASPPPASAQPSTTSATLQSTAPGKTKPIITRPHGSSAKRKLVGLGTDDTDDAAGLGTGKDKAEKDGASAGGADKKKKKKVKKGMLSFNEAEGEE